MMFLRLENKKIRAPLGLDTDIRLKRKTVFSSCISGDRHCLLKNVKFNPPGNARGFLADSLKLKSTLFYNN